MSFSKDLKKGAYGILEPKKLIANEVSEDQIDIVLVPAVACDQSCNRIGYGKGYYDRWLKKIPKKARIGLAYESQITGTLPKDKKDVQLGMVITEKRLITPKKIRKVKRSK